MKKFLSIAFALSVVVAAAWGVLWVVSQIWSQFKLLDAKLSVGILTASTTVLVATLTVVLGKYYERMKDIEAHYRQRKTEIYDEFLSEFFKLYYSSEEESGEERDLTEFLREWQRKMILWGGQDVLVKYIEWMTNIKSGNPNAQSMFLMGEFFLEVRKDLGHKNSKLNKATFVHLILQNPGLFLSMANENPQVTLREVSDAEQALQS